MTRRLILLSLLIVLAGCGRGRSEKSDSVAGVSTEPPASTIPTSSSPGADVAPFGIYFIFDSSGSMLGKLPDGSTKLTVAKSVLDEFLTGDFAGFELALRVYGHRRKEDCEDSELAIPFGTPIENVDRLRVFVKGVDALGRTPITFSLQKALGDFGDRRGEIILITDGIESCDGDPCALIRQWREANVGIRVHVIGFGLDERSKDALKCLSDAAGTDYFDAQSASDLKNALDRIRRSAETRGLVLKGFDESGREIPISGSLARNGVDQYFIKSNSRFQIDEGEYTLSAGVETFDGVVYRPTIRQIQVAGGGDTVIRVDVRTPPRIRADFRDSESLARDGASVTVLRNGVEIGRFRSMDEIYLSEGTYEFKAKPRGAEEVSVIESLSDGDRKVISFILPRVVQLFVRLNSAGTGEVLRENVELWQNGIKKYSVHQRNGATVIPGSYEIRSLNPLTAYRSGEIVIAGRSPQTISLEVPLGFVTVRYQTQNGSRDRDDRVFFSRFGKNESIYQMSGSPVSLAPGRYKVSGWRQKGSYEVVEFEIVAGESKEIVLIGQ